MRVFESPLLRELTILRLGGRAIALVETEHVRDLDDLASAVERLGGRPVSLGRGSNVLAEDKELPLVLVRAARKNPPEIICRNAGRVLIRVEAGLALPQLLAWAEKNGLSGLEGLAGIPGQVGGSVAMNAGSYGVEIGRRVCSMRVFSPSGGLRILGSGAFEPAYREMRMPGLGGAANDWWLIWDVEMALTPDSPENIAARMAGHLAQKRATQPLTGNTAGCVFRNPEGHSAGRLIDEAGLKGRRLGGMAFSEVHANFLVNEGQGTSEQALELMQLAVQAVGERFGVNLQHEVKLWLSC